MDLPCLLGMGNSEIQWTAVFVVFFFNLVTTWKYNVRILSSSERGLEMWAADKLQSSCLLEDFGRRLTVQISLPWGSKQLTPKRMYTPSYTLQKELVLQEGKLFGWDNTMPSFQRACTSKSCNCIFMAPRFLRKNLLYLQHKASLLYQQQFQLSEAFHFQASCSTDTSEHICITKPVLA